MSIIRSDYVVCSVCGHRQRVRFASSLFGMGAADLDGKPPRMISSTMITWVNKCHRCGFVARCLAGGDRSLRGFLRSPAYVFCEGKLLGSLLPMEFYQQGMVALRQNAPLRAYHAFLHAAWVCDDRHNLPGAFACRKKAASLFVRLDESDQKNERLLITQIDLLRRTGKFSCALQLLDKTVLESAWACACAEYEMLLISKKDHCAHSQAEVKVVIDA